MFLTYTAPLPPTTPKATVFEDWHTHSISSKRVSVISVEVLFEANARYRRGCSVAPLPLPPGINRARFLEIAEFRKAADPDYAFKDKLYSSMHGY